MTAPVAVPVRARSRSVEDTIDGGLPPAAAASNAAAREGRLAPGTVVGSCYEIKGVLGEGGMAVVYEALDRRLNRLVALKLARPEVPPDILEREAQALGAFSHPGLVVVHAAGNFRGLGYLVMERIRGQSLADRLDQLEGRAMPLAGAIEILLGILAPLAIVHQAGLVHRDLKPGNVMLTANQRVVLLDFGIARLHRFDPVGPTVGSLHYMAPETLHHGLAGAATTAVDVYSLGVIAYQLVTMHLPGAGAPGGSEGARPSDLVAGVPLALDDLVAAMLSPQHESRPADLGVVVDQLYRVKRGLAMESEPALSVLICDDDPAMVALLVTCVRQARPRASVYTASTASQARDYVEHRAPDLFMVDLQLPGESGFELLMELASIDALAHTEVVVVSSHLTAGDRRLLSQLGISHFVPKRTTTMTSWSRIVQSHLEQAERGSRPRPG